MRTVPLVFIVLLAGCRPELRFQNVPRDQQLKLATHIFIGVIEKQEFVKSPSFRITGFDKSHPENLKYWEVSRRRVRVEIVAKGTESRSQIDIYEISWTDGTTGDWNSTEENGRYVFPVRVESGRYHVVGDWWRSIYPVLSGRHTRLPLDSSRGLWERIALMNWWVQPDGTPSLVYHRYADPGLALLKWRTVKILRGLLRHPNRDLQLSACEELLFGGDSQDECWDTLTPKERELLNQHHNLINPLDEWEQNRRFEKEFATDYWKWHVETKDRAPSATERIWAIDEMRLYTTINNRPLRKKFCGLFLKEFPDDKDNGCPANQPPPATIVTENGDVPLTGSWPQSTP